MLKNVHWLNWETDPGKIQIQTKSAILFYKYNNLQLQTYKEYLHWELLKDKH